MVGNNCMCQQSGVLIFPCSGGSDVGELSACSKKILEQAGFTPIAFNLKDMGFIKGKTKVDDEPIEQVLSKIMGGKVEEADRNTSGGCCGS